MAGLLLKSFIHGAYLSAGKDWNKTVLMLEAVLAGNYNTLKDGQGSVISTTINGKSLSFSVPGGMNAKTMLGMAQRAWEFVSEQLGCDSTGGTLNTFLQRRSTSSSVGDFTGLGNYGITHHILPPAGVC